MKRKSSLKIISFIIFFSVLIGVGISFFTSNLASAEHFNEYILGMSKSDKSLDELDNATSLGSSGEILDKSPSLGYSDTPSLGLSGIAKGNFSAFNVYGSIKGIINSADLTKVAIVPGTDGSAYQAFAGNRTGLSNALYELYSNGNGHDYVLYIGSDIVFPANDSMLVKLVPSNVTVNNVSFASLSGKVGTLVLTGTSDDPISEATNSPATAKIINFNQNVYMGTNIVLRNIRYGTPNLYMQGHSLMMGGGSFSTRALNVFGGTDNGNVVGNPQIEVYSTGATIDYSFYGGNQNGGTLTGNTAITIYNTTNGLNTVTGGAQSGTVDGNTKIDIKRTQGNVQHVYGGGIGTAANKANVTGNVSTKITNIGGTLGGPYYGGVLYGDIAGGITNNLSGTGAFAGTIEFYGGSREGNIGTPGQGQNAITTVFDSSSYSGGLAEFVGGNSHVGAIYGNISNTVTAGDTGSGGLNLLYGGGGRGTEGSKLSPAQFDAVPLNQRAPLFEQNAKFKVYGNIDTEFKKGRVGHSADPGWARGAGYAGYVEGNATLKLGTEGFAYPDSRKNADVSPNTKNNTRGYNTNFDIVGGGGRPGAGIMIYVKGNTEVQQHNVIARWTYGGNFSGIIEGTSTNKLYNGVVDTLEGAGYNGERYYGNTYAYVYGGQVDWFLTGGGWNDGIIEGDVSVEVTGGTINASMGGTYGSTNSHLVKGNSTILVKGGDFSGLPRTGPNGFSGGPTEGGTITGNSSVTLDLRGTNGEFVLPKNQGAQKTYISGGKRYGAGPGIKLGTDANNTIELNIFTDPGSDALNGADIYGDGGNAATTKSGKITVNIDAPGSTVGNFYATEYSNVSSGKILRDVIFNIDDVSKVNGISGGNAADNFTNAIANSSTNTVKINVNTATPGNKTAKKFEVGAIGILNFTDLTMDNATIEIRAGGVKNGKSVTAANHGTTYHQFGDITLRNNANLSIDNVATALISGSMLTISGDSKFKTPSGPGKIIINDVDIANKSTIQWERNGGAGLVVSNGTWFGPNNAYQVITFSPKAANAVRITPSNLFGKDGVMPLLGDNVNSGTGNGYGIAIPGTKVDFKVVDGYGTIQHNVDHVTTGNPLYSGMSSVAKDTRVQEGWISILDKVTDGKLTFTPDAASGSWLKGVTIRRSDGQVTTIPEQNVGDFTPTNWDIKPKGYSYEVEVSFSNIPELDGRHVIISESEAQAISNKNDIITYMEAQGRPFFESDIDNTMITNIKKPLAENENIRYQKVTYKVGRGTQTMSKEYYIAVVKDDIVIQTPARQYAIDVTDAVLTLTQAKTITATDLNTNYTHPIVYQAGDVTTLSPNSVDSQVQSKLNTVTIPTMVVIDYSYGSGATAVTKKATITVIPDGELKFDSIPHLEFGSITIPSTTTKMKTPSDVTLSIKDSRVVPYGSDWSVQLQVSDLTSTSGSTIPAYKLWYTSLTKPTGVTGSFQLNTKQYIWKSTTNSDDIQRLKWETTETDGFSIELSPSDSLVGKYTGVATWTLMEDTP